MKWYFIFRSNISDLPLAENGKYVGKLLFCLLFVFLISTQLSAQNIQIRGTVKDVSGLPVAGANIVVKGTTQGTVSDRSRKWECIGYFLYRLSIQRS